MGLSSQRILFWGPQCVAYWNQYFCAPVYERLKPFGWTTSYYFPPVNEFGSGLNRAWSSWYPHYDPLPYYNIVEELGRSVYTYRDASAIAEALKKPLADERPDIIITRTNGHNYLRLLFPGVPILTMGEAIGAPWFEQHCFSLTAQRNFHGLPHLSEHPDEALSLDQPNDFVADCFDALTRIRTVPEEDLRIGKFYFDELRKKYDRIYLFPSDYTGSECLYLFDGYDNERFTGNADVIHHFKNMTDERTALLVTQHPLQAKRSNTTSLSDIFHPNSRIITADNSKIGAGLFKTSLLAHLSDGVIVRNSKSFWYGLAGGKPILNVGSQDLSVIGAHQKMEDFLKATNPGISRENAIKIFYWQITRQRIALRENEKISKLLTQIIVKATETPNLKARADLFEWGSEDDYAKSFEHCIKTHNKNF